MTRYVISHTGKPGGPWEDSRYKITEGTRKRRYRFEGGKYLLNLMRGMLSTIRKTYPSAKIMKITKVAKRPRVPEDGEHYSIDKVDLNAAVAELVRQFRTHNPSVGFFRGVCHDGSVLTIRVGKGAIGAKKPPPHTPGGNCRYRKKPTNDVCRAHKSPRGECDKCQRCLRCELGEKA